MVYFRTADTDALFDSFVEVGPGRAVALQNAPAGGVIGHPGVGTTVDALTNGCGGIAVVVAPHLGEGYAGRYASLSEGVGVGAGFAYLNAGRNRSV